MRIIILCIFAILFNQLKHKKMTTQEMTNTVIARVNEMKKNVEIKKIMMTFKTNDEAFNWLTKAAIATLMGVQFSK